MNCISSNISYNHVNKYSILILEEKAEDID